MDPEGPTEWSLHSISNHFWLLCHLNVWRSGSHDLSIVIYVWPCMVIYLISKYEINKHPIFPIIYPYYLSYIQNIG